MSLAPCTLLRQLGWLTQVPVRMCGGWEAAGAVSLGFGTSEGSCRTLANPVLGKNFQSHEQAFKAMSSHEQAPLAI